MKFIFLILTFLTATAFGQLREVTSQVKSITLGYAQGLSSDKVSLLSDYVVLLQAADATPASGTFTADDPSNVFTRSNHGLVSGTVVRLLTSGGLPTGLSLATDYYVIPVSSSAFQLATSLNNALAGTAINITTSGTGTQTVSATGLAGANFKLQCSGDDSTYVNIPIAFSGDLTKEVSLTTTVSALLGQQSPPCKYKRLYLNLTTGQVAVSTTVMAR